MESDRLIRKPTNAPETQRGIGRCKSGITNPIENRLANAAVSACVLSGNFIGNIVNTENRPNRVPAIIPMNKPVI